MGSGGGMGGRWEEKIGMDGGGNDRYELGNLIGALM